MKKKTSRQVVEEQVARDFKGARMQKLRKWIEREEAQARFMSNMIIAVDLLVKALQADPRLKGARPDAADMFNGQAASQIVAWRKASDACRAEMEK